MRHLAIPVALATLALSMLMGVADAHAGDPDPWVPAVAFATSGAGLIVGTMAGIATLEKADEFDARCPTSCSQAEVYDAIEIADASTAGFAIAGIGALIGTVTLVMHLYAVDEDDATDMGVAAGPSGVQLWTRF